MQSINEIVTTNKPTFNILQAECPSCCPTDSVRALKGMFFGYTLFYMTTVNTIQHANTFICELHSQCLTVQQ